MFITWEDHRRTVGLSEGLPVPLFVLTDDGGRVGRYLKLGWRTLRLIAQHRPRAVLVQNPSLVLALLACMLRPLFGYKLFVDAHNEAVEPYINTQWPIPSLARWVMKTADFTIVTNDELGTVVTACGGRPVTLPDRLTELHVPATPAPALSGVMDVMVIATYAPDEPIEQIFAAAAHLGDAYRFHVTGRDSKLAAALRERKPANVRLTGFLDEDSYWRLMADSHLVLDLTLMPNCLVCGSYEALAMGRPMVLTQSPGSAKLFGRIAVLAQTTQQDIARAVAQARSDYAALVANVGPARQEFVERWDSAAAELKRLL